MTTTTGRPDRRGRVRGGALAAAAIASGAALAACGSSASSPSASAGSASSTAPATASPPPAARPLATSLSTAKESWAIVPMSASPVFWEVFVRPAKSATWQLVTPPGVADNGGLVAAADGGSGLTVAVRPSQALQFTPVSATADAGASWSADGPISKDVAASPAALAASGRQLAAVLANGTVEASSDAGASWRTLARPGAIAAAAAGPKCAAVHVSSVSFGPVPSQVLAAGDCGAAGPAGLFAYSAGDGWQRVSLPVSGPLVRLGAGTALVQATDGLTALWADKDSWTASAALPVTKAVTASGGLAGATATSSDGTWVLLPGGQAATIGGPGQQWLLLPPTPAHTTVLASGPGTSIDALAVSGDTLTVWQLDRRSTVWARAQTIRVPIESNSSS
ncbi:MAG TPA: hypothetical protein VH021_09425 [Trebonia sp.]|nr:hypothetical protein [Trebonia sp.]